MKLVGDDLIRWDHFLLGKIVHFRFLLGLITRDQKIFIFRINLKL